MKKSTLILITLLESFFIKIQAQTTFQKTIDG